MTISRKKFVILFIISGFAFLFITTSLLGTTGIRGLPKQPDTFLGTASEVAWKQTVTKIILPIKVVLVGPIALPSINFLEEDPPPPFVGLYFIFYWTILATGIHYLLSKLSRV